MIQTVQKFTGIRLPAADTAYTAKPLAQSVVNVNSRLDDPGAMPSDT